MILFDDEALVGQRQRALLAVEAVLVPGEALVVHHVGAVAEPCGGVQDNIGHVHGNGKVSLRLRLGFGGLVGMVRGRGGSWGMHYP